MKSLRLIVIPLLLGIATSTNAQETPPPSPKPSVIEVVEDTDEAQTYEQRINNALSLHEKGKYKAAATEYEKAFKLKQGSAPDYYNAACLWALSGNATNAMKNLKISVNKGFHYLDHIKNDTDLTILHSNSSWNSTLKKIQNNLHEHQKYYDEDGNLKREVIAKDKLGSWVTDFGLQKLIEEANGNSAVAQRRLARYYTFVDKNDKKKVRWLKEAATKFDYTALNNLAFAYKEGSGVAVDKKEAAIYYTKGACIAPYGKSGCFWGLRDFLGLEVASNIKMESMIEMVNSKMTFLILDEYTLGNLLFNLAHYYEDGLASDYKADLSKAKKYYKRSANFGNEYAKK
ncbi:MAG: hypothetical protein AAF617_16045, partial [Bacteroidota bacterium]